MRAKGLKFGERTQQSVTRTMATKVRRGQAIDVGSLPRFGKYYVLPSVEPEKDYVDLERRQWIRSIGLVTTATGFPDGRETLHAQRGQLLASTSSEFVAMPGVKCVWQR